MVDLSDITPALALLCQAASLALSYWDRFARYRDKLDEQSSESRPRIRACFYILREVGFPVPAGRHAYLDAEAAGQLALVDEDIAALYRSWRQRGLEEDRVQLVRAVLDDLQTCVEVR